MAEATVRDLRFMLDVERIFALQRDHDGLAFELAYLGYHTVPWDRVHTSSRKRVAATFAFLDRALHRVNNWSGPGFHRRRIPHLAKQIAKHYIRKKAVEQNPKLLVLRGVLERLAAMWLGASYLDKPIFEADVRRVFLDLGVKEEHLAILSGQITQVANGVRPMFLMDGHNVLLSSVREETSPERVMATVQAMRQLRPLLRHVLVALNSPLSVDGGEYPNLRPTFDPASEGKLVHAITNLYYASLREALSRAETVATIARYASGQAPEITQAIESLKTARETTRLMIDTVYLNKIKTEGVLHG